MSNKKNITYKPDFSYEKSYNTTGNYSSSSQNSNQQSSSQDDSNSSNIIKIENLRERISTIRNLLSVVPSEISSIINGAILGIISTLPYIKDIEIGENSPTVDENDTISTQNTQSAGSNNNSATTDDERAKITALPLPSSGNKKRYSTNTPIYIPKNYTIVDAFDYTMILLYDRFLRQLTEHLKVYNLNIILGSEYGDINAISSDYTLHASDVDKDLQHISDNIVRTEIVYDQKIRLTQKMFTLNNAVNHFNSIYVSKVFSDRYNKEEKQNNLNRKNKLINDELVASRALYYNKYRDNLNNIFKYYNSCAILIGECLNMKSRSFVSKNILDGSDQERN